MSAHRPLPNLSSQHLALAIATARQTRNRAVWQMIFDGCRRLAARLFGSGDSLRRSTPLPPHSHA